MTSMERIKKDLQQLVETDRLEKRLDALEVDNRKLRDDVKALKKELAGMDRKVEMLRPGGGKSKTAPLVDVIEEIFEGRKKPMKVVEIRDRLMEDSRVSSRAENFYAVIATAMNKSEKFEKAGPGLYRYTGGK